jgi:hypothetical protein
LSKGLDEIRRDIAQAYLSKDQAAFAKALGEYRSGSAALQRSLENVRKDDQAVRKTDSTKLEALGSGLQKSLLGAARLALPESMEKGVLSDESVAERERLDAGVKEDHGFTRAAGEFIPSLAAGGLAGSAARAGVGRMGAMAGSKASRYIPWAAEGAAGASVTEDSEAAGGLLGVLGGRAGQAASGLLRALGKGIQRPAAADEVMKYGGDLTPGLMAPDSLWGRIERTATASPLLGAGLSRAREQATRDVVPNLAADAAGLPRVAGEGLEASAQRRATRLSNLYDPARNAPAPKTPIPAARQSYENRVQTATQREVLSKDVEDTLMEVWDRVEKAPNAGVIKELISDLKKTARGLKYSKSPGPRDFATARVYKDAIDELETYHELVVNDPQAMGWVKQADDIVAETKPIERASRSAQRRGANEIKGSDLLTALADSQTAGQFTRGGGGKTRALADALSEIQRPRTGGVIERMPFTRAALGTIALPVAALGATTPFRRAAQGTVPGQKALAAVGGSAPVQKLLRALELSRPGIPGALLDEPQE